MNENLQEGKAPENNPAISFDPATDMPEKTEREKKKIRLPKKAKKYFIIPLALLLLILFFLIGWWFVPSKKLNVCVLDKTVLTVEEGNNIDASAIYRKHQGLFWLLTQQKYVFEDGHSYDYKQDYFGPHLSEEGTITSTRNLSEIDYVPDLMYISDVYGAVDDTYGYFDGQEASGSGLTSDDMSVISYAHQNGASVVAEMDMFNSIKDSSVYSQMAELCGVSPTTWVGRYIYELRDFTDVPDWAPPMYEQQEGVEWQFSGPGILLVSSAGKIIVLEQKTDFESKNLLQIYVNDEYKGEFGGCNRVNFYNWFELVEPAYDTEVLATFAFDVNATGMEKIKEVSSTPRFAAVTRKNYEDKQPVYYFAADFNDYVSKQNYNKFLFADSVYRWISYDRLGDISNFFWNFYNPMMTKILAQTEKTASQRKANEQKDVNTVLSRLNNNSFELFIDDKWQQFSPKAFNINAVKPGETLYSTDFSFYQSLVKELAAMGADCIRAKDLLPSEFYRAVYENNKSKETQTIYIIQTIKPPDNLSAADYLSETGLFEWKSNIETTIKALHGSGTVAKTERRAASTYLVDISGYILSYVIDPALSASNSALLYASSPSYSYSGRFFAANTSLEAFGATVCDYAMSFFADNYSANTPLGIMFDPAMLTGTSWNTEGQQTYSFAQLATDKTVADNYFFNAAVVMPSDDVLLNNTPLFSGFYDSTDVFPYGGYVSALKQAIGKTPFLIAGTGVSTNTNAFEKETSINGLSEREQGAALVRMLRANNQAGCICSVISDLNDDWSALSDEFYPYTVTLENNKMWQNLLDSAQTTGVVALEEPTPTTSGMDLADDDRMQKMSVSANAGYLYITVQLLAETNYDKEEFFIGLDTYQRNDGEYYYAPDYTPTSLSGMEFVLRFDSKQSAALYVVSSYNRNTNHFATAESYSGSYDFVTQLVYGNFSNSENHFYQTGSTIYIRLPWALLNVTDPSQKVVINDTGTLDGQIKTVTTNGILFSLMIADRETRDLLYLFPESKQDPGYKVFKWLKWEKVSFVMREKESYNILKNYFNS